MTEKNAIEILNNQKPSCGEKMIYPEGERCEAYDMAISALEKQMPKRVDTEEDVAEDMCVECPSCGSFLGYQVDCLDKNYQLDYCQYCGQRLDW